MKKKRTMTTLSPDSSALPLLQESGRDQPEGSPRLSSAGKAFGNIIISIVGAGVLGLPYTFKAAGWISTCLVLVSVGLACYYCMMLLVWSRWRLEQYSHYNISTYSDLGFITYGKLGRSTVDAAIVLSQGAFCVAYLIFIGENLASLLDEGTSMIRNEAFDDAIGGVIQRALFTSGIFTSKMGFILVIFPLEVVVASLHSLTALAPFSICADLINALAMAVVMEQSVSTFARNGVATMTAAKGLSTTPFAVGVAIYAYEGIGLVLPLESSMKDRKNFGRVLGMAMVCISSLYTFFGLLGYMAFGEETRDIVTLNLDTGWRTAIVKLGLCFGLFFTFPMMMYPVYEVLERRLAKERRSMVLRALVVSVSAVIAIAVPQFGDFLSLIGNSSCCLLTFVLPTLIHIKACAGEISKFVVGLNTVICLFGVIFGIWGTFSALATIIKYA